LGNHNKELIKRIKERYNSLELNKRGLRLPKRIDFFIDDNKITIKLKKEAVCKNMQDNDAAFEGWALIVWYWIGGATKVILEWEEPDDIHDGHYQRFLFRLRVVL
jgi:hypothetical protein